MSAIPDFNQINNSTLYNLHALLLLAIWTSMYHLQHINPRWHRTGSVEGSQCNSNPESASNAADQKKLVIYLPRCHVKVLNRIDDKLDIRQWGALKSHSTTDT